MCLSLKRSWRSRMTAVVSCMSIYVAFLPSMQGACYSIKSGFELYHVAGQPGSRKALLERICGAWSAPGGKKLLRHFLSQYSPWERLLRQSLRQAGAVPVAFLGSGAFGRVLEAQRERDEQIERIAIKAVLAAGVPAGFSPGAEVEVMKSAFKQGCPVVAPSSDCIEVVEGSKVLGWFHILGNVGTPGTIGHGPGEVASIGRSLAPTAPEWLRPWRPTPCKRSFGW